MLNAKRQAEEYARALPTSHGWPPFILVCDVGHCIEVYADFSGQGKNYTHDVGQLWEAMDLGTWAHVLKAKVKKFNGEFFRNHAALPLGREEIGELRQAASYTWKEVDPSIFGTLVEQALDPEERDRLGAHYTPRAYVERLVVATIIEPLREDWRNVQATAETKRASG